jgi:hypothetical protein
MITTRFAPSPSGRLHLGHAYSAAIGRAAGERFLLRIEDLDAGRLHQRRGVDGDAEPGEVLFDCGDEVGAAATRVEILDPQQETVGGGAAERGAKRMAKVEAARRRWGESRDDHRADPVGPVAECA